MLLNGRQQNNFIITFRFLFPNGTLFLAPTTSMMKAIRLSINKLKLYQANNVCRIRKINY